jgi:hypothetical protein
MAHKKTQKTQGGQVAKLSRVIYFKNWSLEHKNIVFGIIKVSRHTGGRWECTAIFKIHMEEGGGAKNQAEKCHLSEWY